MRVHYKTIITERESEEDSTEYEEIEFLRCCLAAGQAWDDGILHFGEIEDFHAYVPEVCISDCHPYPEGTCWDDYRVNFCPFCGEEIVLIEKEKVRKVPRKTVATVEKTEYDEIKECDIDA